MKIVQVIYFPGRGGMEQYAYLLAEYAKEGGDEVSFIFSENGPLVERVKALGCPIAFIKMRSPFDPIAIIKLYKYFRAGKFDVIQTHFLRENFLSIVAGKMAQVPAIFSTVHRLESKNKIQEKFNRYYSRKLTKFIAVSSLAKSYLVNEGIREGKIVTIPNGAEICDYEKAAVRKEIGLQKGEKIISYVGRFTSEKGQITLIKAFVRAKLDNYKLVLVGDGELLTGVKKLAEKLKISDRIIFTGGRERAYEIIGISDIYVQPSEIENMPLSVVEAMLLGVPIVASDCDAHKLILKNGEFGTLFKNRNVESLARVLAQVDVDKEIQKKAKSAEEYASQKYTAQKMWENTRCLYQKYCQK